MAVRLHLPGGKARGDRVPEEIRIYLTGATGLVGKAFAAAVREDADAAGLLMRGVSLDNFDIRDSEAVAHSIGEFRPHVVVHAAAHALVDECEADPGLALRVNTAGVRHVVDGCRRHRSALVYLSSDYVFDGRNPPAGGYGETSCPSPVNMYGLTKLAGERITALVENHLIVRTSWLFGSGDERVDPVLATVLRAGKQQRTGLVADQVGTPTYTADLARALIYLLRRAPMPTGTIHVANDGATSWYEVGRYALTVTGCGGAEEVMPDRLTMAEAGFRAERPRNSALRTARLALLGLQLPSWRDGVARFCATLAGKTDAPTGVAGRGGGL